MHVSTAPKAASKLTKKTAFLRRELNILSRSEEAGTQGAREARQSLSSKFNNDVTQARDAIDQTRAKSADFERVALCAEYPEIEPVGKASQLAQAGAFLGIDKRHRLALAKNLAEMGRDAADRAEVGLDNAGDDIAATSLLGEILDDLPAHQFNIKSPKLAEKRRQYQSHLKAHRKEKA